MPGRGKKPSTTKSIVIGVRSSARLLDTHFVVEPHKQRDQTDGTGDSEYENGAVRFCSMDECSNYRNLKECARCK